MRYYLRPVSRTLTALLGMFVILSVYGLAQIRVKPVWDRPDLPPPIKSEDPNPPVSQRPEDKQASGKYFVYVDHDYIFTLELVDDKVPVLNFANITDKQQTLSPGSIQLFLRGRRYPVKFLVMDTGNDRETITIPSTKIYGHSSFGYALKGDFGKLEKLDRVVLKVGGEVFELEPISKNDFEMLALKINRVNLASPDIRDDFRVLRIAQKGKRTRPE